MDEKGTHIFTLKKQEMLSELKNCLGIVTNAAQKVGIDRRTHYHWLDKDPEYKKAVEELDNIVLDFAENKLHDLMLELNPTAIIFFLKCKGRKRGYSEQDTAPITQQPHIINVYPAPPPTE